MSNVGSDIRALRKSRGVTLVDMAEQLDRSIGWLSQVERGQTEPSIPDLRKIAALFDLPISFFFRNNEASENERGLIVRANNRATFGSKQDGLVEQLLSPDINGNFEMILSEFAPGSKSGRVPKRATNEGGYLVSGELNLTLDGTNHNLQAGDSFQFENMEYTWENPGDEPAIVVWIISPPVY